MPTIEVDEPKRSLPRALKVISAVLTGLVLAGIVWGIWQWRLDLDKKAFNDAIAIEDAAGLKHDYAGAAKIWADYRSRPQPRLHDYEAYLHEGTLKETLKMYPEALQLYRQAEKIHEGNGTAEYTAIARVSEKTGDLPTAIKYYKKAGDIYMSYGKGQSESGYMYSQAQRLEKQVANDASK